MKVNTSRCERILRIVLGLGIASLPFFGFANGWLLLGLVPVVVGLTGWCPLYTLLGIDRSQASSCCASCCCASKK